RHPWSALPIGPPHGRRLVLATAGCLAIALLFAYQVIQIRRRYSAATLGPKRSAALRARLASIDVVAPHALDELMWFLPLSVTAGICEEWLFRGVITTVLTPVLRLPLAVLACNLAFGLAHSYQGKGGIVKSGVLGL